LTTGRYPSPNLVSTRPVAMPMRNVGRPFRSRSGPVKPKRYLGRVGRLICDKQHLIADRLGQAR